MQPSSNSSELVTISCSNTSGVFRGGGDGATAPPPSPSLTVNFWIIFALFVSFVSRLNRKIRVPMLSVTVRVFCQLKTAGKCTQIYHFGDKKIVFFWGRSHPSTTPHPLDAYGASPPPYWNPICNCLVLIKFHDDISSCSSVIALTNKQTNTPTNRHYCGDAKYRWGIKISRFSTNNSLYFAKDMWTLECAIALLVGGALQVTVTLLLLLLLTTISPSLHYRWVCAKNQ